MFSAGAALIELLKHKLDRTQSIAIANEHLNFSCNEEETHNIYLKLESAKEMFIRHTKNQKKTYLSEDSIPETEPTSMQPLDVKEEIPDSPPSQYNDNVVDCNHIYAEIGTINHDTSDALENQNDFHILNDSNSPSAGVSKENTPSVQRVVSPASGQSVPTDPVRLFSHKILTQWSITLFNFLVNNCRIFGFFRRYKRKLLRKMKFKLTQLLLLKQVVCKQ